MKLLTMLFSILLVSFITAQCVSNKPIDMYDVTRSVIDTPRFVFDSMQTPNLNEFSWSYWDTQKSYKPFMPPYHNWQLNFHPATDALVILDGKVFKGSINDIDPSGVTVEYIHKEQLEGGVILVNSKNNNHGKRN
jgi:hypothetical protein